MTTEPFTPHADSIQTAWVLMCQQSRISTQPPVEELEAEFDRFIARVRRDAAREALDGLAAEAREGIVNRETTWGHGQFIASTAEAYRDTHYPEPFTWTEEEDTRRLQSIADGAADHDPEDVTP